MIKHLPDWFQILYLCVSQLTPSMNADLNPRYMSLYEPVVLIFCAFMSFQQPTHLINIIGCFELMIYMIECEPDGNCKVHKNHKVQKVIPIQTKGSILNGPFEV